MSEKIDLTLKIWRQQGPDVPGKFQNFHIKSIGIERSFFEMLEMLNEKLIKDGMGPIAFNHDCKDQRKALESPSSSSDVLCPCSGACGVVINGQPHGPVRAKSICQLLMSSFKDKDTLVIEPWRAKGFPIIKDLSVDRSAFDRIIKAGGFDPIDAKKTAPCISCGACVAACPNASAMLFTSAMFSHLNNLPQAVSDKKSRVLDMVAQMDKEGFGNCSNSYECEAACPKEISVASIARMNMDHRQANSS